MIEAPNQALGLCVVLLRFAGAPNHPPCGGTSQQEDPSHDLVFFLSELGEPGTKQNS